MIFSDHNAASKISTIATVAIMWPTPEYKLFIKSGAKNLSISTMPLSW